MSDGITRILFIGAGGAIGSILRYILAGAVQRASSGFPIGTMTVNVVGCLLIGALSERFADANLDPIYRTAILVGVLGGFTTFSTFSLDTLKLAEDRQFGLVLANVLGTVTLCLLACWIGQQLAKWWTIP